MNKLHAMLMVVSLGIFGSIASAEAVGTSSILAPEATAITLFVSGFFAMICAGWVKRVKK